MHQSDIRGLASRGRPAPTENYFVESAAFYQREYRTQVTAHIGWAACRFCRACTEGISFSLVFLSRSTYLVFLMAFARK
jgi:hypothetical protein